MRLKCPKCGERVDATDFTAGDRIHCPQCQTRLKLPTDAPEPLAVPDNGPFDFDDEPRSPLPAPPQPQPQPLLVPVPYSAEHPEYTQEKSRISASAARTAASDDTRTARIA